MRVDDTVPGHLRLIEDGVVLIDYVHAPTEPQLESPRPYALLAALDGRSATGYRPGDHVWHKGLSLALPDVGPDNFWGGPTYVRGQGYVQLPNNGAQVHRGFDRIGPLAPGSRTTPTTPVDPAHPVPPIDPTTPTSPDSRLAPTVHTIPTSRAAPTAQPPPSPPATPLAPADWGSGVELTERLDWVTQPGRTIMSETRRLTARRLAQDAWALTWHSRLTNLSSAPLAFGSPTAHGRDNAGYAGLFWRGPEHFTGGVIIGPNGPVGDAARGTAGPWLAFLAPPGPDSRSGPVGLLMVDAQPGGPHPWFARSEEYAGLCPAPFFYAETIVEPEADLKLAAVLVVGGPSVLDHLAAATALAADLTEDPQETP
ncbi:MAG: PmoA family protein [Propionibacteriaceae bacterium]|jgi:hypothetical protein|nr:PmoA family protein [Propionibacteriaceae bacterium]